MLNFQKTLITILAKQQEEYPTRATIYRIDGSYADVRFGSSPSVVRNVEIVGNPYELSIGEEVLVYWESMPGRHGKSPVIYVSDSALMDSVCGSLPAVDGVTIDYGVAGLHVPRGGISMANLNFVPSVDGHKHRTPLEDFGWNFTNDGILFANDTYIHPDGQIQVGTGNNTVKLDSLHATYRLWAGAQDPTAAPFSVTKAGALLASSGVIAGWDIAEAMLSKNNVQLDPAGEIIVGTSNDVAVLSSIDVNNWRLWIGHATPGSAPFRVSKTGEVWLDNAHVATVLESSNYQSGLQGWKLDQSGWAEFQDVVVRGVLSNVVFQYDPISIVSGRIRVADSVTLIADLADIDTTMDVQTNTAEDGEIVQFKASSTRKEWISIASDPSVISGGYRYDIVRDLDGGGAVDFYTGESGAVTGAATFPDPPLMFGDDDVFAAHFPFAGRGYSSQGGFLTLDGSREYGPYFGVARRFGASYNQLQDVARFGLLSGFLGETREVYGIAIGDAVQSLRYSYEDGLSLQTRSGQTVLDNQGLRTDAFGLYIQPTAPSYVDQTALLYVDEDDSGLYCVYKDGASEYIKLLARMDKSGLYVANTEPHLDLNETDSTDVADYWRAMMSGDEFFISFWDDTVSEFTYHLRLTDDGLAEWDGYAFLLKGATSTYLYLQELDAADPNDTWRLGATASNFEIQHRDDSLAVTNTAFLIQPNRAFEVYISSFDINSLADSAPFRMYGFDDHSAVFVQTFIDAAGAVWTRSTGDMYVKSDAGDLYLASGGSDVIALLSDAAGASAFRVQDSGLAAVAEINSQGNLYLREQSTDGADISYMGQIWIKDDSPNILMFTDGDGTVYTVTVVAV